MKLTYLLLFRWKSLNKKLRTPWWRAFCSTIWTTKTRSPTRRTSFATRSSCLPVARSMAVFGAWRTHLGNSFFFLTFLFKIFKIGFCLLKIKKIPFVKCNSFFYFFFFCWLFSCCNCSLVVFWLWFSSTGEASVLVALVKIALPYLALVIALIVALRFAGFMWSSQNERIKIQW